MKFGNHVVKVFNCFYFGGDEIVFERRRFFIFYFIFCISNLGGELVCTYIICCYCIFVTCYVSVFISTHTFDVLF